MEPIESVHPEMQRRLDAKERRRCKLVALSFPEKVRALVQLQRMVAPILRGRGRRVKVWDIEDS